MENISFISYICNMKELRRIVREILFELMVDEYYPIIVFNNDYNSIRFYLDENDRVKKEVFITNTNEILRKTLTENEIDYCLNNIDNYIKYKRVGR